MEFTTTGQIIECRAAVSWAIGEPFKMETIQVAIPKAGEVRVKIVASGVCHSDLFFLRGGAGPQVFPCILGHEGAGIVESVGPGVTSVAPGDHVIPLYTPQCYECDNCKSPYTNVCTKDAMLQMAGFLSDGTSRFTCNGQVVKHNMGCSTFAEYTVVNETNVSKIDPTAPLDKVCLIGCAIATGYGAALNTAKVRPGSTVAIWGLGGVGLAAAMGAKKAGAARIIGVDINPAKAEIGKMFGITEFVNPKDHEEPIEKVLVKMTNGGVDHALECCGIASCMKAAFAACKGGGGVLTLIGLAPLSEDVPFNAYQFIAGKSVNGTYFGGWKSRDQVPKLVEDYLSKELMVDELITHTLPIESINDAVDLMKKGDCVRSIVKF